MKLTAQPSSQDLPNRIDCRKKDGQIIATVFTDHYVKFAPIEINPQDLNTIITIRDNFQLFYENLKQEEREVRLQTWQESH